MITACLSFQKRQISQAVAIVTRTGGGLRNQDPNDNGEFLQTLCQQGQLQKAVLALSRMDTALSDNIYMELLKACTKKKSLFLAKQIHGHISIYRPLFSGLVGNYLVVTLSKCGAVDEAIRISRTLPFRRVGSWTAIISAYADIGYGSQALQMYQQMLSDGLEPDARTFVSLLKACSCIPDIDTGRKLHEEARTRGFMYDIFVGNSLISMYGKCGAVGEAEGVFVSLCRRDIVSWNSMLSVYVGKGDAEKTLLLYRQMMEEGMQLDPHSVMFAIQGCSLLAGNEGLCKHRDRVGKEVAIEIGKALHSDALKTGIASDVFVGNTLVKMYGKCGAIQDAENLLIELTKRDVISWTAMLSACIEKEEGLKALHFFVKMHEEGVVPDHLAFVMALQACGILVEKLDGFTPNAETLKNRYLYITKALHSDIRNRGFTSDVVVGNTLVTTYGKLKEIMEAEQAFFAIQFQDVISWTAMLSAYVENDQGNKALSLYRQMKSQDVTMNDVSFICVLQACYLVGSLETCKEIHFELVSAGYDRIPAMMTEIIQTYQNSGSMDNAQAFFDQICSPDIVAWTASCVGHAEEGNCFACLSMMENFLFTGNKPDEVMFVSALTAFNHSGLSLMGLYCFESMVKDYGITPNMKHYGIMIDILGRAGDFQRVECIIHKMPMQADWTTWLALLGASGRHGNVRMAKQAFNDAVSLHPKDATPYVLMSNTCVSASTDYSNTVCLSNVWTCVED